MKKIALIVCLLVSHAAFSQRVNQCGIVIPPQRTNSTFSSVYEARDHINTMLDSINWKENFTIQEQYGIDNAYATIIQNRRYIIYDNNFLENLDAYARTEWASISVLAHEMGHHYRNHVIDNRGSTPPKEIEADYFSGYVLSKLGASLNEARAAMNQIASPQASSSHPAKQDRINAITNGWNYAKGLTSTTRGGAPTQTPRPQPAPQPQQNPPPASNDASWIYLSLYGNSAMTVYLSDDNKTFQPAPLNPTQPFVFKFEVYPYGWMRFNAAGGPTYRLTHGKDYAIIWSRRNNSWTVIAVP